MLLKLDFYLVFLLEFTLLLDYYFYGDNLNKVNNIRIIHKMKVFNYNFIKELNLCIIINLSLNIVIRTIKITLSLSLNL